VLQKTITAKCAGIDRALAAFSMTHLAILLRIILGT